MERVAKVLVMLAMVLVVVLASDVEGGRLLVKKEEVDQPQNFIGGIGGSGIFPSPGFVGVVFGPNGFCTYPGGGCTTTLPNIPSVGARGSRPPHA